MIFDYFFLKLYNRIIKSDIGLPRFCASVLLGGVFFLNIMTIECLLAKLDILPAIFVNKTTTIIGGIIVTAIMYFIYNKNRIETIKLKVTKDDFKSKKKMLDIVFVSVIILTFIAMIFVPLYKPGYLPKIDIIELMENKFSDYDL